MYSVHIDIVSSLKLYTKKTYFGFVYKVRPVSSTLTAFACERSERVSVGVWGSAVTEGPRS